jgi:hypothetical protein
MENFTRSEPTTNRHIKSFIRPQSVSHVTNPHFYHVYNKNRSFAISGNLCIDSPFNDRVIDYKRSQVFIAHYITQSEEEFKRRKGRTMDDGATNKDSMYKEIHNVHNETENLILKNKYSNGVKDMLTRFNISL